MITEEEMNEYIDELKKSCDFEIKRAKEDRDNRDKFVHLINPLDTDVFTALATWVRLKSDFLFKNIHFDVIKPKISKELIEDDDCQF